MADVLLTEIKVSGTDWANISGDGPVYTGTPVTGDSYVYVRNPVTITRGRADEDGNAAPARCALTLDNRGGEFSPRNPLSPFFGKIGRNTPVRVSIGRGKYGMVLSGGSGRAETADSVATSIAGDIDIRVDMELLGNQQWDDLAGFDIASKWEFVVGRLNWSFYSLGGGTLAFAWYPTGTTPAVVAQSTSDLTTGQDRRVLRVTLDVNNGAAGNTTMFYTGTSLTGPWTQLGAPVVKAGVTSIFDGSSGIRIGSATQSSTETWGHSANATVYGAQVRSGLNGTVVASPDFTPLPLDPVPFAASAFSDTQGNSWIFNGTADAARIWYGDADVRFVGEIASLPPRWDPSGLDAYVPVEANGLLRRLGQGTAPAATGLRDYILSQPTYLVAYYPLAGGEGTTYSLNLAPDHYYLQTTFFGQASFGQIPVFTYGRDMGAAWLGTGMELNATGSAYMRGDTATADANVAFDMVFQAVPPGLGVLTVQLQDYNLNLWAVDLNTAADDGTLQVSFTDPAVGPIGFTATGQLSELQDTNLHHLRFQLTTSGGNTNYAVYIDGTSVKTGSMASYVVNGNSLFRLFYTRYTGQTVMNIAHLALWSSSSAANIPDIADVVAAAFGYVGETAGDRVERVADLAGIPIVVEGTNADTIAMGAQYAEPTLTQIRDAENADLGVLTETRDDLALLYRTRSSMYNQDPTITIDYSAGELSPPFEPVDDDQLTRNDVTATRRDGDSYRVTKTTGPLSVQDPPTGVGRYQDERTLNVETDAMLPAVAQWLLNIGTLNLARYPSIVVNLAAPEVVANATLTAGVQQADVGDLIRVTGLEDVGIYEDVDLIILGVEEVRDPVETTFTFNCMPAAPYQVAEWGAAVGTGPDKYDADGSQLTSALNTTATSFTVTKTGTSLWTTVAGEFPLDIYVGGERMTVTNITSPTSPQTFTVTRSVNQVVKSHSAGAEVRLWKTPRYAL